MANDLDTLTKDLYLQRSRSGTALRGSLSKSDSQISGSAGALIRLVGVGMMVAPPQALHRMYSPVIRMESCCAAIRARAWQPRAPQGRL